MGPIEQLQAEGRVDSQGRFTLDPRLGAEKLGRYRQPDPHAYILNLVASAVAGEATRVRLTTSHSRIELEHDGFAPGFHEMTQILECLLQSPTPAPHVFELGLGLHALRFLQPSSVQLETAEYHMEMTPRQMTVTPRQAGGPGVRLCLNFGGSLRRIRSLLGTDVPELQLLKERCLHCPILLLAPEPLNRPVVFKRGKAWFQGSNQALGHLNEAQAPPENSWGQAWACFPQRPQQLTNLEMVIHGVSYEKTEPALEGAAVVFSRTLIKDLSQAKVVENDTYRAMVKDLNSLA